MGRFRTDKRIWGKMAKGPKISENVKVLVVETKMAHPDWLAKEVQSEVNKLLKGKGPGLSAVQKILVKLPRPTAEGLEAAWSLAESARPDHNIPLEANADLLKIWRWCQIVGRNFTIREAQWVARLRGIIPFDSLLMNATLYAARERASYALKQPLDTTDVDAMFVFDDQATGNWLYNVMVDAGVVSPYFILSAYHEVRESARESKGIWKNRNLARMFFPPGLVVAQSLEVADGYPHQLPLPADEVYALCLRRLALGPKWLSLTKEAKEKIAKQLHDEVRGALKEIKSIPKDDFLSGRVGFTWMPSRELRKAVGIVEEHSDSDGGIPYNSHSLPMKTESQAQGGARPDTQSTARRDP